MGFDKKKYILDWVDHQHKDSSKIIYLDNIPYLYIPNFYSTMFLLDKNLAKEYFLNNVHEKNLRSAKHGGIREKFAAGLNFYNPPNGYSSRGLICLEENYLNQDQLIHHSENTYSNNFAK